MHFMYGFRDGNAHAAVDKYQRCGKLYKEETVQKASVEI
jgi:hypothetical protein